jgi:hydroxyacylglutathione hydrolase
VNMTRTRSLFLLRRFTTPQTLSGCALAALTVFSSTSSSYSWPLANNNNIKNKSTCRSSLSTSTNEMTAETSTFTLAQFPCLQDNYGFLLHDPTTGETAAIDTPDAKPYKEELEKRGWKLTHIFNTHHHHDHTGGNLELKEAGGVTIYGPINEKDKIRGIDKTVDAGDTVQFGPFKAIVMDVGGHTKGHIAFYFPDQKCVFVGDSLFALGCGKMFEGTASQFWKSLKGLRDLPDDTVVYCAHEYTASNAKFALSVEPNNQDLVDRVAIVKAKRARGEPTVPTILGEEKKANPFLRVDFSEEIRKIIGVTETDSDAEAFGKLRKAKDNF